MNRKTRPKKPAAHGVQAGLATSGRGEDYLLLLGLMAICALLFLWDLGGRSLWETDEARYAEIAREMLLRGDWISPHLNYVKYFEKPPLTYWLVALSFKLFGISSFSARLTPAVFGTLTVAALFFLGRRMWNARAGLFAGLCLATSLMFLALSRVLLVDMVLCFGVTLALWGAWALRQGAAWGRYAFWGGCAVGLLTKGLLGPGLPIMVAVLYGALAGEWVWLKNLARLRGLAFFILLCMPWLLLISLANPEFPKYFFIDENLGRLLTTQHQRYQPFYFYLLLLPAAFFPWVALTPWALAASWPGRAWRSAENRPWLFAAVWFLSLLIFLSLSRSKMVHYALPMLPALALTLGQPLARLWAWGAREESPKGVRWGVACLGWLMLLAGLAVLALPALIEDVDFAQAGSLLVFGPLALATLGLGIFLVRGWNWGLWASSLAALLTLAGLAGLVTPRLDDYRSLESLVAPIRKELQPDDLLVCYADYYHGAVFYGGRRVAVVRNWGELDFGRRHDPQATKWFIADDAAFVRLLRSPDTRVLAVGETQAFMKLKKNTQGTPGLKLFEWGRKGDKSLFSNRPRQ